LAACVKDRAGQSLVYVYSTGTAISGEPALARRVCCHVMPLMAAGHAQYPPLYLGHGAFRWRQVGFQERREGTVTVGAR